MLKDSYQNLFRDGQPFNVTAFISHKKYTRGTLDPVWQHDGFVYNYSDTNEMERQFEIPVSKKLLNNHTLYLHVEVEAENNFASHFLANEKRSERQTRPAIDEPIFFEHESQAVMHRKSRTVTFYRSVELIKFQPLAKQHNMRNLLSFSSDQEETGKKEEEELH